MRHTRQACHHNAERHTVGSSHSWRKRLEATSMWTSDVDTSNCHIEVAMLFKEKLFIVKNLLISQEDDSKGKRFYL